MGTPFFLERLGLDTAVDERDVRRAYARELKKIDQEQDAAGFQHLRECYEHAQSWLRYREQYDDEDDAEPELAAGPEPVVGPAVAQETAAPKPDAAAWEEHAVPPALPLQEATEDRQAEPLYKDGETMRETEDEAQDEEEEQPGLRPRPALRYAEPAMTDAELVIADFLPRLYAAAQSSSKPTLESVREGIRRCLADPRMVSLDASDEFENIVAHTLVQGWKPGHETLFVAALLEFDWEQDIRRLQRLDYAGNFLAHAIAERQHFFQQEHHTMEAQRKVIEMMRQPVRPTNADLVKYAPLVEGLLQRYPHVLAVIAGRENAEQWLQCAADVPEAVRRNIMPVTMQQPSEPKSGGRSSYWWVGIAIYAGFQVLRMLSSSH